MAGLNDILTAYKNIEADIAAHEYLKGLEDLIPAEQALIDFGRSLGFKSTAADVAVHEEIEDTLKRCCDSLAADTTKMAAGAFDWKGLLSTMLMALMQWWATKP